MEVDLGLCPQNWLPRQRALRDRNNNFRSFSYGESSTNPANFVKISLEDVEIIGLTEITKIFLKQQQNISPPRGSANKSGSYDVFVINQGDQSINQSFLY